MISSGAMQAVGFKLKIWEFSKSQHDIIDGVIITKIIVVDIICYVGYDCVAKCILSILQPSNMAANCGLMRSCKPKVKPNLGCRSTIAITLSYISVFISSWYFQGWRSYGRLSVKVT